MIILKISIPHDDDWSEYLRLAGLGGGDSECCDTIFIMFSDAPLLKENIFRKHEFIKFIKKKKR